mgnify:CR=1 FL=1
MVRQLTVWCVMRVQTNRIHLRQVLERRFRHVRTLTLCNTNVRDAWIDEVAKTPKLAANIHHLTVSRCFSVSGACAACVTWPSRGVPVSPQLTRSWFVPFLSLSLCVRSQVAAALPTASQRIFQSCVTRFARRLPAACCASRAGPHKL